MPRYIDADALRASALKATKSSDFAFDNCFPYWQFALCIKQAPTADVAPVVRGEWELLDECSNAGVYCSVCHKAVFRERAWYKNVHIQSKFCPNCGARMDGEL